MVKRWSMARGTGLRCALALVVLALAGCMNFEALAPKEPVTIRFVGGDADYFEDALAAFNKDYPHITVDFVSWRSLFGSNAGETVDVFLASQAQLRFFLEDQQPWELSGMIQEDDDFLLDDFYPNLVEALSTEGQRWGVPVGADVMVMYYNRTLFDQANVPYPEPGWTWQDFLERAQRLSQPDAGLFGYAYHQMGNLSAMEPMVWVYQHGGRLFDDLQNPGRMVLNEPATVEALAWYGSLINEHHVAPRTGERRQPYPQQGIENGQYAMWMGWFSDEREPHWGVVPLPRDQNGAGFGTTVGLFIASETSNPEACWDWVSFLSHRYFPGLVPARRSLMKSDDFIQAAGEAEVATAEQAMQSMMSLNLNLEGQMGQSWGQTMNAFSAALAKIRAGEPAQVVLDDAQRQIR